MSHYIKITNKNKETVTEYYNGHRYAFEPDEPMNVEPEAIAHWFGFDFPANERELRSGDFKDKAFNAIKARWGWNRPDPENKFRKIFDNIHFLPVLMQQVELVAKNEDPAPPREEKSYGKPGKVKPPQDPVLQEKDEILEAGVS